MSSWVLHVHRHGLAVNERTEVLPKVRRLNRGLAALPGRRHRPSRCGYRLIGMQDSQSVHDEARHETRLERLDRNFEEMTGELRVVVTGVQVLFAFLLIVPFDTGFAHIGSFERTVYFVTLIFAALAAVCTIAPSAEHRFLFHHDDKQHLVFSSNRVVIAGLACLALAMCGCLLLVTTKLFGLTAGVLTASIGAAPFAVLWFALPIRRLHDLDRAKHETERST
jgi:hypothetical protein